MCGADKSTPDDIVHYELRLDRPTLDALRALASRHGCGIGGEIRHIIKNALASSRRESLLS